MERAKLYLDIVRHYEACLQEHGDTHRGVDWPSQIDAEARYEVMLGVIQPTAYPERVTLLDFGCGTSHLLEFIRGRNQWDVEYSGLDISPQFVNVARTKFPDVHYLCGDILSGYNIPEYDYIVMNGVFTEKRGMSFESMLEYFESVMEIAFQKARRGIAFNVMSKQVDWEREDLFHLPLDTLANFLTKQVSRDFIIRNDYGLYEYTTYVFKRKP